MARPRKSKYYTDEQGIVRERRLCCVENCSRIRMLFKKYHSDGSLFHWEHRTCCHHRVDGDSFHCYSKPKNKERIWKAQGINISYEIYKKLLEIQDGKCAICGRPEELEGRALSVDHCHRTGKIRGIICRGCNSAIGWVERFMPLDVLKDYLESDIVSRYGDILENSE